MPAQLRRVYLMLATWFLGPCLSVAAQQSPVQRQFDKLAEKVVKTVTKTEAVSILTTPLSGCLGEPQLCADFDAVLRASLQREIPAAKFIDRDDAAKHLADHGFLSIDAYLGALTNVGRDAGAEVVIDENFERTRNTCHLKTTITDAKHLYELGEFSTDISCTLVNKTTLSVLKDPSSSIFLIVPLPESSESLPNEPHITFPTCLSCPDPHYTTEAKQRGVQGSVRILFTVKDDGTVENAEVLGAVEEGLALASIRAVSGWKMKPAVGPDGKPFRARVPVEVTFRLLY